MKYERVAIISAGRFDLCWKGFGVVDEKAVFMSTVFLSIKTARCLRILSKWTDIEQ